MLFCYVLHTPYADWWLFPINLVESDASWSSSDVESLRSRDVRNKELNVKLYNTRNNVEKEAVARSKHYPSSALALEEGRTIVLGIMPIKSSFVFIMLYHWYSWIKFCYLFWINKFYIIFFNILFFIPCKYLKVSLIND